MSLVQVFQEMKRIHGFCPCCGEVFRLSDATIYVKGAPPRTPFDTFEAEEAKQGRAEERLEERLEAIQAKSTELGQKEARKKLKKIAGYFVKRGIDPQEVKSLFDPVDYVAFRGLHGKAVKAVEFIDRPARSQRREKVQTSLAAALKAGNVGWRTWRIDADAGVLSEEGK